MSTAAGIMSAHAAPKVDLAKFGMVTFLASEAMLFAGLISAYLISWISAGSHYRPEWIQHSEHYTWPVALTGFNTVLLVTSSFTLLWAERNVLKNKGIALPLLVTTALGAVFVSIQAHEWLELRHENLWWNTGGTYTSNFFLLTGFHGLHVCIGVVLLFCALVGALLSKFTPHRHTLLTCASLYWHFVDVVWIIVFTIMYIIPWWMYRA